MEQIQFTEILLVW